VNGGERILLSGLAAMEWWTAAGGYDIIVGVLLRGLAGGLSTHLWASGPLSTHACKHIMQQATQ